MAGRILSRGPERGRGVSLASQSRKLESHLILARKIRGLESHLSSASYFGTSFQQAIWASLSGISIWRGFLASKFSKYSVGFKNEIKAKKRRVNCVLFRGPVISNHRRCILLGPPGRAQVFPYLSPGPLDFLVVCKNE